MMMWVGEIALKNNKFSFFYIAPLLRVFINCFAPFCLPVVNVIFVFAEIVYYFEFQGIQGDFALKIS